MAMKADADSVENSSVLRLIEDGLCTLSDVRNARMEAARLFSPGRLDEMRGLERSFRVLGDRNRLAMLALLSGREMCVCEIMSALGLTQPTASRNLGMLEQAGLVLKRRRGKWAFYSAAETPLASLVRGRLMGR